MFTIKPKENQLNKILFAVFSALSLLLIFHHEPWRDEAQAWLLVREVPDFATFIHLLGYEGSPALWHLLILPLVKTGQSFFALNLLHFVLALIAVGIFLKNSPFSPLQKFLAIFGYYLFFEYNVIARSYVVSVICLFSLASLYPKRLDKPLFYALLIALLANTNSHSFLIALVFATSFFYDQTESHRENKIKNLIFSQAIILIGCLLVIYQLRKPHDLMASLALWDTSLSISHIGKIPNAVISAFLPLPIWDLHFWNSKLLYETSPALRVLGIPVFILLLSFFSRKKPGGFLFFFSSLGLFALFFLKHSGQNRHHGLLFILFLTCLWIDWQDSVPSRQDERNKALSLILGIQFLATLVACTFELQYPFSASHEVAQYLLKNQQEAIKQNHIAVFPGPATSSILPYLPKGSQFYYLDRGEAGTYGNYMIWDKNLNLENEDLCILEKKLHSFSKQQKDSDILFILNRKIEKTETCAQNFELLWKSEEAIVKDESYFLYQYH